MPYLEDFRNNDLGNGYFILPGRSSEKISRSYDRYATKAFYDTFKEICDLENSRQIMLHSGSQTHSSIAFWFITLESYVSALLKICCIKFNRQLDEYLAQPLAHRVTLLVELLDIDKKAFNENRLVPKLHEFARFRSELFHERDTADSIQFHKTMFSPVPFLSNQADTFQAILILLEVTQRLKNVFRGINTMPQVLLVNGGVAVAEDLDTCYMKILLPCMQMALEKHDISTHLDLVPPPVPAFYSPFFNEKDVEEYVVVEQDQRFTTKLNKENTLHCLNIFNAFIEEHVLREESTLISD